MLTSVPNRSEPAAANAAVAGDSVWVIEWTSRRQTKADPGAAALRSLTFALTITVHQSSEATVEVVRSRGCASTCCSRLRLRCAVLFDGDLLHIDSCDGDASRAPALALTLHLHPEAARPLYIRTSLLPGSNASGGDWEAPTLRPASVSLDLR